MLYDIKQKRLQLYSYLESVLIVFLFKINVTFLIKNRIITITNTKQNIMETISRILIGKLFRFYPKHTLFVIVGVRKNSHGLEILIARYYEKSNDAEVYAWYGYHQSQLYFEGRSSKEQIRRCLKSRPDKIHYHLGKSVDRIRLNDKYKISKEYSKYWKTITYS